MSVLVLVSVIDCAAGDCAPTPAVNGCRMAGVSTSWAPVETYSVTPMVSGLLTAAAPVAGMVALIVMVPLQVPAGRPAMATATVRLSFVTPVNELLPLAACSQLDPQLVVANDAV